MVAIPGYSRELHQTASAQSERNVSGNRSRQTRRTSPLNNLTGKEESDFDHRTKRFHLLSLFHDFVAAHCITSAPSTANSFISKNRTAGSPFVGRYPIFTWESPWFFRKNKVTTEDGNEPLWRDVRLQANYQEANFTSIMWITTKKKKRKNTVFKYEAISSRRRAL